MRAIAFVLLLLAGCQARAPADGKLSAEEINQVRREVARCWTFDVGMEGIEQMSAEVNVELAPDGRVLSAEWDTPERFEGDPNYVTFAESARNAVLECSPLELPPEEYEVWRRTTFVFDARGVSGP